MCIFDFWVKEIHSLAVTVVTDSPFKAAASNFYFVDSSGPSGQKEWLS